jgi:hypothetical protein
MPAKEASHNRLILKKDIWSIENADGNRKLLAGDG